MNVQSAARQQLTLWHGILDQMLADCSEEVLNKNLPEATITSIASIYAHIVFSEDFIVQGMLQGKPTVYHAQGWEPKLGVQMPGPPPFLSLEWGQAAKIALPSFQEYAKVVRAASDSYLAGLSDSELESKVNTPAGEQTVAWALAALLGTHAPQHAGEIAALKGVQGLKGLPF
ncbi:MAG: hypothetical protein A2148_07030 [Chloroflexi bacterium RBG_16_68_14]|nr:MAG: hypothetical protein A2148_07030 [Chloroflexi bacterium RBG_16_68_14]